MLMALSPVEFLAYEITKSAVAAIVKPLLTATFGSFRTLSAEAVSKFGDRFVDYISIQAERHSRLNTIVFGHKKSIADLYIPLTLVSTRSSEDRREHIEILIDRFHTKLLPTENRILITDTAGMGKSTLSKFLFLQSLKSAYAIPIFLELRHLSSQNTILSVIQKQLNSSPVSGDEPKFSKRQVEKIFKKGGLIIFLDGYDEVPFKDREVVTKDIKDFLEKYPENIYIITSRPESGLLAFPSFKQYGIRPLRKEESFSLIHKYDQGGGRAEQLISKLTGRDFLAVQEFLKNPLLTSLLYRSFEYKQNIPIKKHIFYRQVFDALFDWHDASKDGYNTREKKSGLDIDTFHRVLRIIGFVSVMKGEIEGDTDTMLAWIRKARAVCSTATFSESDFLDDLIRAVPVFVKDGDYYRWSHKSLAEYFAAQYICTEGKAQQAEVLTAFMSSGQMARFSNVLDQIYDVDVVAFRSHLILPTARAFVEFWKSAYYGINPQVAAASIRLRKEVSFDKELVIFQLDPKTTDNHETEIKAAMQGLSSMPGSLADSELSLIFVDSTARSKPRIAGIISGSFTVIISILASKKDPLVRRAESIDPSKLSRAPTLPASHTNVRLTDNPNSEENQPEFFDKYTRLLLNFGPAVDSDKMLAFESSFRDSDKLSELADELLSPMRSAKTKLTPSF